MNQELAERIRRCEGLPAIPRVAVEVLGVTSETLSGAAKVAQVVSSEPRLAARALGVVNGGGYGLPRPVSSMIQAVTVLGLRTVKTLILGLSLSDHLAGASAGRLDLGAFRRRGVYSAAAARALGRLTGGARADACFLSSLLMDSGMVALDKVLGADYARLVAAAPSHRALAEAERRVLGLTHADASGILADHWRLPPLVRDPMVGHHRRPEAAEGDAPPAWLAGRCADVFLEADPSEALREVRRECEGRYGLRGGGCDEFLAGVGKAGGELEAVLDGAAAAASPGAAPHLGRRAADQAPVQQDGAEVEKRRTPRSSKRGFIAIAPFVDGGDAPVGETIRLRFRDLSRNGVGLTSPMAMKIGSRFLVRLPRQGGDEVPLIYCVVRCDARAGAFDVGAELAAVRRPDAAGKEPDATGRAGPGRVSGRTPRSAPRASRSP